MKDKIWKQRTDVNSVEEIIFKNFGVSSASELNEWFKKSYANEYTIKNMKEAVSFAKKFMDKTVTIIGDYDADGTTATSILLLGLKEYGFKDVRFRIPHRFSEGFGINEGIIDEINSGLIITCDNGIAGINAIKKAKEKGLSVIVTDHHEPVVADGRKVFPDADYIIDPNAIDGQAVFNGYCGAGIAYKFICELFNFNQVIRYKYLGLAAIGTVADVMQLREENYVFVRNALPRLANPAYTTVGLNALIRAFEFGDNKISSSDIAFRIGPAINSASRTKDWGADFVVELLTFNGDANEADELAKKLLNLNKLRKEMEESAMKKAEKLIIQQNKEDMCPLIVNIPSAGEGIIGIVAGNLCEKYGVPTLVFTDILVKGEVVLKGSARSCGGFNIKEAFDRHSDLFIKYGGHAEAAGMSVYPKDLDNLEKALREDFEVLAFIGKKNREQPVEYYDAVINPEDVKTALETVEKYAPYGNGNPEPVFLMNFKPVIKVGRFRLLLGKDESTIKLYGKNIDAIGFSMADRFKYVPESKDIKLFGTLFYNYYRGNAYPQIQIKDFEVTK